MLPPSYEHTIRRQVITRPKINEEVKLFTSTADRRKFDDLADFYAIFLAAEQLEKAYQRDIIPADDYTSACNKLISQFKSAESTLIQASIMSSTGAFISEYQIDLPRAVERLVNRGVPATVIHATTDTRSEGLFVAETTQFFINALDALSLGCRTMDEIHPHLRDIMASAVRVPGLVQNVPEMSRVQTWVVKVHQMRATEELTEDDKRQLTSDLNTAYSCFHQFLRART